MVANMSSRTALDPDIARRGPTEDVTSWASSFHLVTAGEAMSSPAGVIDADRRGKVLVLVTATEIIRLLARARPHGDRYAARTRRSSSAD